jgi:hypothetical protein
MIFMYNLPSRQLALHIQLKPPRNLFPHSYLPRHTPYIYRL